ncbi:hypothetical protein DFH09DRAFT_1292064 [Mycena vulgaris]|nr:hypothetical protein DFH09DRAFT_1292064 [Mycena vulgaris]
MQNSLPEGVIRIHHLLPPTSFPATHRNPPGPLLPPRVGLQVVVHFVVTMMILCSRRCGQLNLSVRTELSNLGLKRYQGEIESSGATRMARIFHYSFETSFAALKDCRRLNLGNDSRNILQQIQVVRYVNCPEMSPLGGKRFRSNAFTNSFDIGFSNSHTECHTALNGTVYGLACETRHCKTLEDSTGNHLNGGKFPDEPFKLNGFLKIEQNHPEPRIYRSNSQAENQARGVIQEQLEGDTFGSELCINTAATMPVVTRRWRARGEEILQDNIG